MKFHDTIVRVRQVLKGAPPIPIKQLQQMA